MCGRFCLRADNTSVSTHFALTRHIILKPRYNIAPGQVIPVIRRPGDLEFINWGFAPKWLKAGQKAFVNARMETLFEKPAFKYAIKQRRCLIVADGYYEWRTINNFKQAYFISLPNNQLFAFAGLWEDDGCCIITKAANQSNLNAIHDRMPVIIAAEDYVAWLDLKTPMERIQSSMHNSSLSTLQITPVSNKINNPQHDFIECIKSLH